MDYSRPFRRLPCPLGTTLPLCGGTRLVRVLTLPMACDRRGLLDSWDDCFGLGDDLVVWPPPGPHQMGTDAEWLRN
jgi:hypothetical protein